MECTFLLSAIAVMEAANTSTPTLNMRRTPKSSSSFAPVVMSAATESAYATIADLTHEDAAERLSAMSSIDTFSIVTLRTSRSCASRIATIGIHEARRSVSAAAPDTVSVAIFGTRRAVVHATGVLVERGTPDTSCSVRAFAARTLVGNRPAGK